MVVLVFNNGSTSLRFSIVDTDNNVVLANGGAEKIGTISSYFKYENNKGYTQKRTIEINNSNDALELIIKYIFDVNVGVLNSVNDIDVIGHRVVHGREKYFEPTFIDAGVLNDIEQLSLFSPLYNKKIAENIKNCQIQFYGKENIAVFDTSFHLTVPKENYLYAIPQELYENIR